MVCDVQVKACPPSLVAARSSVTKTLSWFLMHKRKFQRRKAARSLAKRTSFQSPSSLVQRGVSAPVDVGECVGNVDVEECAESVDVDVDAEECVKDVDAEKCVKNVDAEKCVKNVVTEECVKSVVTEECVKNVANPFASLSTKSSLFSVLPSSKGAYVPVFEEERRIVLVPHISIEPLRMCLLSSISSFL
jgi:hypothetical protein